MCTPKRNLPKSNSDNNQDQNQQQSNKYTHSSLGSGETQGNFTSDEIDEDATPGKVSENITLYTKSSK